MSEELDIEALRREWRKIDMRTIELALETGKLRRSATWSFVFATAILLYLGYALIRLAFVTTQPWSDRLPGVVIVGVGAAACLWFFHRQWRAVQAADALLTRTPIDLINGRRSLLEVELFGLDSRLARIGEFLVGPGAILGATVLWRFGYASVWVPLGMAVFLASYSAYVRLHRIPWVRAEIAKLEELERTLA